MKANFFIAAMAFPLFLGGDTMVFTKTFGGSGHDFAYSIRQTGNGGYIVAGQKDSIDNANTSYPDVWILKLDSTGRKEWDRTFGDPGKGDGASSVQLTTDGGYVVAGQTDSQGAGRYDMWILKLDENGDGPGTAGIPDPHDNRHDAFSLL
jgi:hypothetical protein